MHFSRRTFLAGSFAAGAMGTATAAHAYATGPAAKESKTDVLVVGTGLSGVVAALAANEAGVDVLMIDKVKRAQRGGNSRVCLGSFLMPKDETAESKNAFIEDVKAKSMGGGRVDLYEVLAERILPAIKWAESKGAQFEPWLQQAPWRVGVRIASPGQYRGMPKLLETLHDAFEKAGGKERFEVKAKALLLNEKGAVCGCRVLTAAGFEDIHAGAVVLATGGYSANRAMLESCHPGGGSILIRGNKWITGDGILLAQEIGAGVRGMAGVESLHLPIVYVGPKGNGSPTRALPYCIGINDEGRRFADESAGYASFGKAVLKQPNQRAALIFDEALKQNEKRIGMCIELFEKAGGGFVSGRNAEELAEKLGVPAPTLRKTIEEFNASVKDGKALGAAPPKKALAAALNADGPLYAFSPLTPSITMVYGGVVIDKEARVLEADERVIRGLFAAGETVNLYYQDYHGGGILAQCLAFGRLAGEGAAAAAQKAMS